MKQKVQLFLASIKQSMNPKIILRVMQGILVAAILATGFGIYLTVTSYMTMQKSASTLNNLAGYAKQKSAVSSPSFRTKLDAQHTLDDVIVLYGQSEAQIWATKKYYDALQQPYQHFLQYFLLPPLNIWKDKYTGKIDDTLVGKKFLSQNAYLDVNLISQWTDFFKNIGINSPKNDIKNITVGSVSEKDGGIFTMPITVSFVAETKRSFLLLVDKVSMTSNRANISLLNEFFYNIWAVLQEKQALTGASTITAAVTTSGSLDLASGALSGETSAGSGVAAIMTDAEIGEKIYRWAKNKDNTFITDDDINNAIQRTAWCEKGDGSECYFKFREKYRGIPEIAYTIGLQNSNKSKELRLFLSKMPPMINVKSFTFNKQSAASAQVSDWNIRWYAGNLVLDVYWKSMTAGDVAEIASYLWALCTKGAAMSPTVAVSQIDTIISQSESVAQISNEKSKELSDLKATLVSSNASYDNLPGFKKAVKLFEMYRMLSENKLCSVK
jgi:hypothetical protein